MHGNAVFRGRLDHRRKRLRALDREDLYPVLPATGEFQSVTVFTREIAPRHTGRLGYALRVSPNHYEDPLTRPCPDLLRWS